MRSGTKAIALFLLISMPLIADAFPSWMGVYGSYVRHNGGNPGQFTVLMNQDYYGLHAEVVLRVNGGSWSAHEMTYVGNAGGNAIYQFTPSWEFPATQIVEFYFHGWDNWGENIWDSNYGQNYWFPAYHNGRVQWVGNSSQWPASGAISSNDNLWVNLQSWPSGAAKESRIVYTTDRGLTWVSSPMSFNGVSGNNDAWNVNLGKFRAAETVRYAIEVTDWAGAKHWDNNGGFDFYAQVNYDNGQDEDGDGMPNGWEIAIGLDPTDPIDADDDKDQDELTNLSEYQVGSDPAVPDSDGDGLSDAVEVLGLLTAPMIAQTHSISAILSLNGSAATNLLGSWSVQDDRIVAATNRGALEYALSVPQKDVYLLEIQGFNSPYINGLNRPAALDVFVDNDFIRRVILPASASNSVVRCVTPVLTAGSHSVQFFWDNDDAENRLWISSVKLYAISGPDSNGNGLKDWVENWINARNGAVLMPPSSAVSPAFMEGRVAFFERMSASTNVSLRHGSGARWYANVNLSANNSTMVSVSYEDDAVQETENIVWRPTNILLDDSIKLRKGDALLLTAHPLGAVLGDVLVGVQGQLSYTTTVDAPVPVQFTLPGVYTITGIYINNGQTSTGHIVVTVLDSAFTNSPAAWIGKVRGWNCGGIGTNFVVQVDPSMRIASSGPLAGGGRSFNFLSRESYTTYAVARLNAGGAIVDNVAVRAFRLYGSDEVGIRVINTYADGSQLVEMGIVQSPVEPDVAVKLEILVAGVTFEDGSITRTLTVQDFDILGRATVRFIRPAETQTSVCHSMRAYQGDVLLGE